MKSDFYFFNKSKLTRMSSKIDEYIVECVDGQTITFTKKQIKLIPSFFCKFLSTSDLKKKKTEVDHSYECIAKIHEFLQFYSDLPKKKKVKLFKPEVISGKSAEDGHLYIWCKNWITSSKLWMELNDFRTLYDFDLYIDILGLYIADRIQTTSPEELAAELSDRIDNVEDSIVKNIDWLDGLDF